MNNNLNRIAYIIGNDTYQDWTPLEAAVNDANLMDVTLRKCGFLTNVSVNLNYEDFRSKINEFKYNCMEYHVGLFYYAGHGFEHKGQNYLCPIDAEEEFCENNFVNITGLVNEISKDRDFISIIILDCCRRNCFNNVRGNSLFNPIVPNFKNNGGTYIAYATTSGEGAYEDEGNGLYTGLLCEEILAGNDQIEQVFKKVRKNIIEKSLTKNKKNQIPWEYSSLVNEFYFMEKIKGDSISSLVDVALESEFQYEKIVNEVNKYCEKENVKDKNKTLLEVLLKIDERMKGKTYE